MLPVGIRHFCASSMLTISYFPFLFFFSIPVNTHSDDTCQNELDRTVCAIVEECDDQIELENILDQSLGDENIFFIETSPKTVISSREACALESAARNSDLNVVMVRVGRILDIKDNTTCQIFKRCVFSFNI